MWIESYSMCYFFPVSNSALVFWNASMLLYQYFIPFHCWIVLYRCYAICLFICPSMDVCLFFFFQFLAFTNKIAMNIWFHMFSFLLGNYLGKEWMDHICLNFEILNCFPKWLYHIMFPFVIHVSSVCSKSTWIITTWCGQCSQFQPF